ncbi:MAG: tripartite tricarboxylate transporter substrate binding protein [Betaproteobacteria bacterium]|nr:tripartite tricarboxylate transporter substrate binding protein [Betaproteobacteria bacterium]
MQAHRCPVRYLVLCAALWPAAAAAQSGPFPIKPLRVIVPFPPGGSVDFNARAISDRFAEHLGQPIVVDNRGGASGTIGSTAAARSAPDGYTLVLQSVPFVTAVVLYKNAGYDPLQDFAPISLMSNVPMALTVHPSLPVRTVGELIALARARPGEINYAGSGVGSNSHITGELFNMLAKTSLVPIQYKGGGPALAAVVSGEVQVGFSNIPQSALMVAAKRLRPIGVSSLKPSPALPGVPPVAEAGLPGFEFSAWHGLLAPRGTPPAIVDLLNRKLIDTIADPVVVARFQKGDLEPVTTTPGAYTEFLRKELEKWRQVIRDRNIRAE